MPEKQPTKAEKRAAARAGKDAFRKREEQKAHQRRLLLRGTIGLVGLAAIGVPTYLLTSYLNKSVYTGSVEDIRGKELVTPQKLDQLTDSLIQTGHPFLGKIGSDIKILTSTIH